MSSTLTNQIIPLTFPLTLRTLNSSGNKEIKANFKKTFSFPLLVAAFTPVNTGTMAVQSGRKSRRSSPAVDITQNGATESDSPLCLHPIGTDEDTPGIYRKKRRLS